MHPLTIPKSSKFVSGEVATPTHTMHSPASSHSSSQSRMHSPRTPATPSQFRGRLPKQIRRALPIYVALTVLFIFISIPDSFGSSLSSRNVFKRHVAQTPMSGRTLFPKKIWQTWKVGPFGFEEREIVPARSWTAKNPYHRYEVLTDNNDLQYVVQHFGPDGFNRPDIVNMYQEINVKIVKADLLRYLIMYAEGGVYADIDVEALKPIDRWMPERYSEEDIDMIVGVEIDQPGFNNHPILGSKSQSFCQWTFACKPRLPVMMHLIEQIIAWLNDCAANQGVAVSDIQLDFDEVISGTGPSAFTDAILAEMTARAGRVISWDQFHDMNESKLVSGVLALTVEAFAAGQGHSDSGNHDARTALVKHYYHASGWPSAHPRFSHPLFGEVERCNWVQECVDQWDADVAAHDELTPKEQEEQLAKKRARDEADREKDEAQAKKEADHAAALATLPPLGAAAAAAAAAPAA